MFGIFPEGYTIRADNSRTMPTTLRWPLFYFHTFISQTILENVISVLLISLKLTFKNIS